MKWVTNEFCIHNWATFDPLGKKLLSTEYVWVCAVQQASKLTNSQKLLFFPSSKISFSKCQVNLNWVILKVNNIWLRFDCFTERVGTTFQHMGVSDERRHFLKWSKVDTTWNTMCLLATKQKLIDIQLAILCSELDLLVPIMNAELIYQSERWVIFR